MSKPVQHTNVTGMVRSLSEDKGFVEAFEKQLSRRQLVKALAALRAKASMSQQEVAKSLRCTQAKVSKLEAGDDAEARFGDLVAYTEAVGHEMLLFLVPKGQPLVGAVKMHAMFIHRLLHRMVENAGEDDTITEGVACFLEEASSNLTDIVSSAFGALPPLPKPDRPTLQVEPPPEEKEDADRPRRRRGAKPPAPVGLA